MRSKLLSVAVIVLALLAARPALAGDEARGACSGGVGEWRLKVRPHDGALRIRFEISDAEDGERWQLFVSDDGQRVYAGTRFADDGGQIRVRTATADRAGRDRIKATGVNLDTGTTCSGVVAV
ncbi:MAG: hypothetical protein ACXWYN_09475 [Actinomycetota bacterium]